MASMMRKVRKSFRKEVLQKISTGCGNTETLMEIAGKHFGHDVGYEELIKSFLQTEVSNAVSQLRVDGHIETVGRKWKSARDLNAEDIDAISIRRLKRLRGEIESQVKLAHEHGRTSEAIEFSQLLGLLTSKLQHSEAAQEVQQAAS